MLSVADRETAGGALLVAAGHARRHRLAHLLRALLIVGQEQRPEDRLREFGGIAPGIGAVTLQHFDLVLGHVHRPDNVDPIRKASCGAQRALLAATPDDDRRVGLLDAARRKRRLLQLVVGAFKVDRAFGVEQQPDQLGCLLEPV